MFLFFLLFLFDRRKMLKNTTFYIGEDKETKSPLKITSFIDITYELTIISSKDFQCTKENSCTVENDKILEVQYEKNYLVLKKAWVQINIVDEIFGETMNIWYLENDSNNFGSIIGFMNNSSFLNYFYIQNNRRGNKYIMRLDWQNNLVFKNGIYEMDKLSIQYNYQSEIIFPKKFNIPNMSLKLCLTNRLDMDSSYSYLGIKNDHIDHWKAIIRKEYLRLTPREQNEFIDFETESNYPNSIEFQLLDNKKNNIGSIYLALQELYDNENFFLKSFDNKFDKLQNCDLYTGTLLLKKYNFKYYYIEYSNHYEVKIGYDNFKGYVTQNYLATFWYFLEIFLVIAFIILLVYFVFKYLFTSEDDIYDKIFEEEREEKSLQIKDIELSKSKSKIF